jgi:AraC-like DNA-binding protein
MPPPITLLPPAERQAAASRFRELTDIFEGFSRWRSAELEALAQYLLLRAAEHWRGAADRVPPARMERIVQFVRENLTSEMSRARIAGAFHLTPGHVNHIFRKELGCTPSAFINRERCQRACWLLENEGVSVKEAAYAVGYRDPAYFSRVFRRYLYVPPQEVRQRR